MTTPANDLAAIHRFTLPSWLSIYGRHSYMYFVKESDYAALEAENAKLRAHLAPTLDALAAAQEAAAIDAHAAMANADAAKMAEMRADKAEADCAALRQMVDRLIGVCPHEFEGSQRATACIDAHALLQATAPGQGLLDELARLEEHASKAERGSWESAAKLHAAESALRVAKADSERLDWLIDAQPPFSHPIQAYDAEGNFSCWVCGFRKGETSRAAMDAAMRDDAARKKFPGVAESP